MNILVLVAPIINSLLMIRGLPLTISSLSDLTLPSAIAVSRTPVIYLCSIAPTICLCSICPAIACQVCRLAILIESLLCLSTAPMIFYPEII